MGLDLSRRGPSSCPTRVRCSKGAAWIPVPKSILVQLSAGKIPRRLDFECSARKFSDGAV